MSVSITFNASNGTELTQTDVRNIVDGQHTGGDFTAIIGSNVQQIQGYAFEGQIRPALRTNMKSVIIPKTVTQLGNGVFNNCNNLAEAEIHRYVNDDTSTPLSYTSTPPFNLCASPFTLKIHSDTYWDVTTNLGIVPTEALLEYIIIDGTTTIAADEFKDKNLIKATIPDSVTSIGDYAFSGVNGYQYVFIELAGIATDMWLGIDDIEIFDTQGNKVSQNGNWDFDSSSGEMTTTDGDAFYYTESYHDATTTTWHARRMVNGLIATSSASESNYFGIIGYHTLNRSYQLNIFESQTNHYNEQLMTNRIPYCVFKFNEPKDIGKIIIHSMRRAAFNDSGPGSTSNHNIYLANNDSVTMATMPANFFGAGYVTPTIPWISGTNYRSIMNSSSGVNWVGNPSNYQYLKQYDFSTTPLNFSMSYGPAYNQNPLEIITFTGNSNLESIGEGCFKHTKISSITLPNTVTTIGNSAFENCSNLSSIFLSKASYQYVFIEAITNTLHMAEIEVFDIAGIKISQNGNWTLNTSTGDMTTTNGDAFYFSEMRVTHTSTNSDANSLLDGFITTISDQFADDQYGIVGNNDADNGGNGPRSYQRNCFESATETGDDTPYCVLKFNEPKYIGKIVIHCRRTAQYNNEGTLEYGSNHNIYLANDSDISSATRPNGYAFNSYTTPTIPWISGTNYKSILHSTSGVSWGTTASGTSSNFQYDKTYDFSTSSFAFTFNTPSSLTTIGDSCFKNSVLNSIAIPNSVTAIGDYAFANNPLTSADIHTYTNNVITDSVTIGNEIFSLKNNLHDMVPFELTVHSDRNMNDEFLQGRKYQYVFYSRDCVNQQQYSTIAEFEVWDNNDNRISHTLDPTIIWSSRWETSGVYQPEFINDGILDSGNHQNEWHCRQHDQSVYNVFGSTEGTYKNSFIGYNFGTPQHIKKIVLTACGSTGGGVTHDGNIAGSSTDKASKINGYKLYFTNDVIIVPTSDSNTTPVNYTCVDPDKDYVVIDSYNNGTYVDATHDTYTHDFSSSISVNYNIIDGTTTIPANEFKNAILNTVTLPSSLTTIGETAFFGTNISTIVIPESVTNIGESAFGNCTELVTAKLQRFTNNDVLGNEVSIGGNGIFDYWSSNGTKLSIDVDSNYNWSDTIINKEYRYIFYERDLSNIQGDSNASIGKFEVWDHNNQRISHSLAPAPTIMWSSWYRSNGDAYYNPSFINDDSNTHLTGEWHSDVGYFQTPYVRDVFGKTTGSSYIKSFIGYDFGSKQSISKVALTRCSQHAGSLAGNVSDIASKINGYKIYFTNYIKTVTNNTSNNFTPSTFTCVDPDKPYAVMTSYHDVTRTNYDHTFTHDVNRITTNYNILTDIPPQTFSGDKYLKTITLEDSVTDIGDSAFENVTNLESVTCTPTSQLESIGNSCFKECYKLNSLTIPNSVTSLGSYFIDKCYLLTVNIPTNPNFTTITDHCFYNCGMTSVTIPDNVSTLGTSAFSGNEPNYFQYVFIEAYGIEQNLKLAEIEIWDVFGNKISQNGNWDVDTVNPNSITPEVITTTNGDNFYYSCTNTAHTSAPFGSPIHPLTTGSLPSNMVNGVVPTTFNSGSIIGNGNADYAYQPNCFETNDIRPYCAIKFNEPKIISSIVVHNFRNSDYNTSSAHNIHLANDDSVTMATMPAGFSKPDWVTSEIPYISGSNYISIKADSSGVPWTDPGYGTWRLYKEYEFTPYNFSVDLVTTLSRITECLFSGTPIVSTIGESCFNSSSLSNISIPDSVTDIKKNAFFSCRNLTSCTLPINSNFTTITQNCFRSSGLTSITIPDSVTTIESAAFYFATSLGPCILPNSVTSLGDNTFEGTTSMTSCTLPINNNFTTIPRWCFKVSGLTSITIPDSVTLIDGDSFYQCQDLTSVTFNTSSKLTTIGAFCFKNSGLTSIMIPNSVTTIGSWAFENNPLTSFSLPNNPSFTSIPDGCFLKSIYWTSMQTIPYQVTSVGSYAFTTDANNDYLNDNETYLKLPRGLKSHVDSPGSYTTKYDSRINLEFDHFGPFKTNNSSVLVKYESSGTSNEIELTSGDYKGFTVNGAALGNFRKGIINENLYNYTLLYNTLQPFYDIYPYAVAGDIGYIWSGGDIGKRICPYYTIFGPSSSSQSLTLIPGWTRLGIFAVGGGGGGGGGGWAYGGASGGWQGGRMGAGSGGSSGGVGFVLYNRQDLPNLSKLKIDVGAGGAGGANWTGWVDRCGKKGELGTHSVVKDYDDQSSTPLMEAYRGGTGSGGWIGWNSDTATIYHIDGGNAGAGTNDYQKAYSPDYEARDATVRGHDSAGNATAPYHGSAPTPNPGFACRSYGTKYTNVGNGNNGNGARDSGGSYPLSVSTGQSGGSIQHNLNILGTTYGKGGAGGNEGNQGDEGGNNGSAGVIVIFQYFNLL